jgi:hypothetical protein
VWKVRESRQFDLARITTRKPLISKGLGRNLHRVNHSCRFAFSADAKSHAKVIKKREKCTASTLTAEN